MIRLVCVSTLRKGDKQGIDLLTRLNIGICDYESSQKEESVAQSADSSKAYTET